MDMTMDRPPVPTIRSDAARTVAVIGAGFSGTMAAIHLRRNLPPGSLVLLVERGESFGRGVAYAESGAPHMLNVRAANMGALADDPGHFERWATPRVAEMPGEFQRTAAGLFATRRIYGRYLRELLDEEIGAEGAAVRLVTDEVLSVARGAHGWRVVCRGGEIAADGVVLACGSLPAARPCDGIVFHNPWTEAAMAPPRGDGPVLIVGTGLTMADLALSFRAQDFAGKIIALSRRGLLPLRHEPVPEPWAMREFSARERGSALGLLRAVRKQVRAAAGQGIGWRAVIDSLRPITVQLWDGLPAAEKQRFLRHLRPYWDTHRHRMAPPVADGLAAMRASGALDCRRGRVCGVTVEDGRALVTIRERTGTVSTVAAQRVIFATGLEGKPAECGPVVALLRAGLARVDAQGLGIEVTPSLGVLGADGIPVPGLWALGPLVRGVFWECTAVPDIRVQAQFLGGVAARALV